MIRKIYLYRLKKIYENFERKHRACFFLDNSPSISGKVFLLILSFAHFMRGRNLLANTKTPPQKGRLATGWTHLSQAVACRLDCRKRFRNPPLLNSHCHFLSLNAINKSFVVFIALRGRSLSGTISQRFRGRRPCHVLRDDDHRTFRL